MSRGFTLIELLVALALLALLGVLSVGVLDLGLQTRTRLESTTGATREINAALQSLRRLIEQAVPPDRQSSRDGPPPLSGRRDGLDLLSRPPGVAAAPPQHLRLTLQEGNLSVERLPMPDRLGNEGRAGARNGLPRVLLRDVEGFELNYFGAAEEGEPVQWLTEWHRPQALPQRIRLHLRIDGQTLPALIVLPRRQSLLR